LLYVGVLPLDSLHADEFRKITGAGDKSFGGGGMMSSKIEEVPGGSIGKSTFQECSKPRSVLLGICVTNAGSNCAFDRCDVLFRMTYIRKGKS
jgi:hypothetical protein